MTSRWVREAEEVFINTQPHISQIVALLLQHYFINIIKKKKKHRLTWPARIEVIGHCVGGIKACI